MIINIYLFYIYNTVSKGLNKKGNYPTIRVLLTLLISFFEHFPLYFIFEILIAVYKEQRFFRNKTERHCNVH